MKKDLLIENTLAYALKKGAGQCEIFDIESSSDRLVLDDKGLSDAQGSENSGFSVRILRNGVLGFSYGASVERSLLERAVDDAITVCDFLTPEPCYEFTPGGLDYPMVPWEIQSPVSFKEKETFLNDLKSHAMHGKYISKIDKVSLGFATSKTRLKNSLGLDLASSANYVSSSAVAVAENKGEIQTGGDFMAARLFSQLDSKTIGENAAFFGANKLDAITVETGEYPVILDSDAVLDFLSIILPGFLGDNIRKGQSRLKGKLGERMTHKELSLYDDALMEQGISSSSFDDQGIPCEQHRLIDRGSVNMFLYDVLSANKSETKSTGNGFSSSAKSLPGTGLTNYYLGEGTTSLSVMMKDIKRGIYIRDLMGLHMANGISGDFSLGLTGNLIESGELTTPIRGNMVAGNAFELFMDVEAVGDTMNFYGYRGAPPLRVKSMKISGKT